MDQSHTLLSYLGLPEGYSPSPSIEPIEFLKRHLRYIPPHLITYFSTTTTPKQRTLIPAVRNRRSRYTESSPTELGFNSAKNLWPTLWEGRELRGKEEAKAEEEWAAKEFFKGKKKHVGKLGSLLGGYEEEREAERVRNIRRREAEVRDSLPEEDEDTTDEEDEEYKPEAASASAQVVESPAEMKRSFLRLVKERFIYGLLEVCEITCSRAFRISPVA